MTQKSSSSYIRQQQRRAASLNPRGTIDVGQALRELEESRAQSRPNSLKPPSERTELVKRYNSSTVPADWDAQKGKKGGNSKKVTDKATIEAAHTPEYAKYLRGHHWRKFRSRYFTDHSKCCVACGKFEHVELHHKTYDRLWHEDVEDVVALCQTHHSGAHEHHKKYPSLTLLEATDEYIRRITT